MRSRPTATRPRSWRSSSATRTVRNNRCARITGARRAALARSSSGSSTHGRTDRATWDGNDYQARFDSLAARGVDVHGEVAFVLELDPVPKSVLDAGCGTGRVAIELARRGVVVAGVDVDPSMLATARKNAPAIDWLEHDLATLDLGRTFDVVVMAGNVPLFTAPGTHAAIVGGCARHVALGGALLAGVPLGRGYQLDAYDRPFNPVGLTPAERLAYWGREPLEARGAQ